MSFTGASMTTDLAVVQQLHITPDLPERDRGAAEAVAAGLRDAEAGNTRRAYSSAWRHSGRGPRPVATPHGPPPRRPWPCA